MALSNFAELQAAIGGWLARSNLTARIPDFIALAEARINRELRVEEMETSVTGTLSGHTLPVPDDLVKQQRLVIYPAPGEVELQFSTPANLTRFRGMAGQPVAWCKQKGQIYLAPVPDGPYAYELFYMQRVPALSTAASENWLLTSAPDVYLYAALLEAEPYIKNDKRLATWASAYQAAMAKLAQQDADKKIPSSQLVIRSDMWL